MPISYVEVLIISVLSAWFIGSILQQFGFKWFERISAYDAFLLLPIWTFFAPNPGRSDYHVVYRDRRADGSVTAWREVEVAECRRPYTWLWNPEKRSKKVISDFVATIATMKLRDRASDAAVMLSLPYLLLLNTVCNIDTDPGATHRQFVLLETFGFNPTAAPQVLLRSDFHPFAAKGVANGSLAHDLSDHPLAVRHRPRGEHA